MVVHAVLSLASGGGGLDLGVKHALGGNARTVCYVENEVTAAAVLVARMEEERLDQAPIWSDLKSFDGEPWRGLVDGIIGGYPCQPFSVAGKQLGAADPRHLWPYVVATARAVQPRWCFFENVAGHLRLGGHEVIRDLQQMGYRTAATLYRAEEVGAPHRRERLFILAVADAQRFDLHEASAGRFYGAERTPVTSPSGQLVHPASDGRDQRRAEHEFRCRGNTVACTGCSLGDTNLAGLERRCGAIAGGADQLPAWPPSPTDDARWARIPERFWPATVEPAIRDLADGATGWLARADQLRILGNGVVPAQAAAAFTELRKALDD